MSSHSTLIIWNSHDAIGQALLYWRGTLPDRTQNVDEYGIIWNDNECCDMDEL